MNLRGWAWFLALLQSSLPIFLADMMGQRLIRSNAERMSYDSAYKPCKAIDFTLSFRIVSEKRVEATSGSADGRWQGISNCRNMLSSPYPSMSIRYRSLWHRKGQVPAGCIRIIEDAHEHEDGIPVRSEGKKENKRQRIHKGKDVHDSSARKEHTGGTPPERATRSQTKRGVWGESWIGSGQQAS